jgi:hypothetical protein
MFRIKDEPNPTEGDLPRKVGRTFCEIACSKFRDHGPTHGGKMLVNKIFHISLISLFLITLGVANNVAQVVKVIPLPKVAPITAFQKRTRPPRVLTPVEKLQRAQKILDASGQKAVSMDTPLTFSVKNLYTDKGEIQLYNARFISGFGDTGAVDFDPYSTSDDYPYNNSLNVEFLASSPGKYLVDVSLYTWGAKDSSFNLIGQNTLTGSALPSSDGHLLYIVEATKTAVRPSTFLSSNRVWRFYSCEISKLK